MTAWLILTARIAMEILATSLLDFARPLIASTRPAFALAFDNLQRRFSCA